MLLTYNWGCIEKDDKKSTSKDKEKKSDKGGASTPKKKGDASDKKSTKSKKGSDSPARKIIYETNNANHLLPC